MLLVLAIGMTLAIILSGSRGGILFCIPVLAWQLWRLGWKNIPIMLLFGVSLLYLVSFLPVEYVGRIKQIPQSIFAQSDTVGLRFELWKYAIHLWQQKPILGIGTGMFVYLSDQSPVLRGLKNLQAHNTYITYLAENGIVGLALFLIIIIRSMINFEYVAHLKGKLIQFKNLAITWESILMIFLLNGIKGNLNANKIMWFSFAISIVLGGVVSHIDRPSSTSEDLLSPKSIRRMSRASW